MAWNPKYEIDLRDVFDRAYSDRSSQFRDALRPTISDSNFKQLYANKIITRIRERTSDDGLDKNNERLKGPYSKSYSESLNFQIYGKSRNDVNLTLTGKMLSSLNSKNQSSFKIVIQLDNEEDRGKAQGHITGRLGTKGRAPRRDFLGVTKEEEEDFLKESVREVRNLSDLEMAELLSTVDFFRSAIEQGLSNQTDILLGGFDDSFF
jgi:hypothetical protein